jgi:uncharacterized protein YcbK (DUF882 family)
MECPKPHIDDNIRSPGAVTMTVVAPFENSRRSFLKVGAATILTTLFSLPAMAAIRPERSESRQLAFFNIHTGESLKTRYRSDGNLVLRAMRQINHIMRDYRTGEIKPVDPKLLDLLSRISQKVDPSSPIHIISGYRSARTNAMLRKTTSGVARNSFHMAGRAIDIRIPGCRTDGIYQMAKHLGRGGVGYYPESDFVHLDTGPVRFW